MKRSPTALPPSQLVDDLGIALRALRLAARDTLIEHKRDGDPIVVWQDGRVVWIPADEIVIPDESTLDSDAVQP